MRGAPVPSSKWTAASRLDNVAEVVRRGARVVVAGSAIFVGGDGIHANTAALRAEIARAIT